MIAPNKSDPKEPRPESISRQPNTKTADFRASGVGTDVIVESRRTSDEPSDDWRLTATLRRALAKGVATSGHSDVTLVVHREGTITAIPRTAQIAAGLRDFLKSPAVRAYVSARLSGQATVSPVLRLPLIGAASLRVFPFVRPGGSARDDPIDFWAGTANADQPDIVETIRRALHQKATRYGKVGLPYVVSLIVHGDGHVDESVIEQALFGDGVGRSMQGRRNGLWNRIQNTRLGGVIVTQNVVPTPPGGAGFLKLYTNPWATYPVPAPLTRLAGVEVSQGNLVDRAGEDMRSLFP